MTKLDRLSALIENFRLKVRSYPAEEANLIAYKSTDDEETILIFHPQEFGFTNAGDELLFALQVDFGGTYNPLVSALPSEVSMSISTDDELASLIRLLTFENQANRCGASAVLGRLGEVLLVRILRDLIDSKSTNSGMLAGLADARLSRAIVEMHERPGKEWRNADLAELAGLSHSRFKELFVQTVGENPASYLRRWRLTLAKTELERGERVDKVSRKFGYRAPDAFSRAFARQFGVRPKSLNKSVATQQI